MNTRITQHSIACERADAAHNPSALRHETHAMNPATGSTRAKARLRIRRFALAAMALTAMAVAGPVFAGTNCSANNKSAITVTFTLPAQIIVPQNAAIGDTVWTSPLVPPASPSTPFSSCGNGVLNGLWNATWGGPITGSTTLYPTSLSSSWLSFRILDSTGQALASYGNQPSPSGSSPQLTAAAANAEINQSFQLQLVITGPMSGGSQTLPSGQLVTWAFTSGGDPYFVADTFFIGGSSTIIQPCTIAVDPTVVTLPPVTTSTFTSVGTTAGAMPFQIKLTNCPTGNQLGITLSTSNPYTAPGVNGVILNTAATQPVGGVGVQLLDANNNNNPVTFGTAIPEGQISGATVNLPFVARYYQTGAPVTAGNVTAVATYTLNYQ